MAENSRKIVDNISARTNASDVWKKFGFYLGDNGKPDKSKAICKICYAEKPYVGRSTSNLRTHLNTYHMGSLKPAASENKAEPSILNHFEKWAGKAMPKDSREYKNITGKIADWLCSELMPLSTVDKPAFKEMVKSLNPRYVPPCRDTIANVIIPQLYTELSGKLKEDVTNYKSFACTTDGWTSAATESYVTGLLL